MDWWHVSTVVVLVLAVLGELLNGYCVVKEKLFGLNPQRRTFGSVSEPVAERGEVPLTWAVWPWVRFDLDGTIADPRLKWLDPAVGILARGVTRLGVGLLLVVRFAAGQPPPWVVG